MFLRTLRAMPMDEAGEAGAGGGGAGDGGAGGAGEGAGGGADWFQSLPQEVREHEAVANFAGKSFEELARQRIGDHGFISRSIRIPDAEATPEIVQQFNEKLLSVDGVVRVPDAEASAEDRAAFYNRLGRPESADGYKFENPADLKLPEGVEVESGAVGDWFRSAAHEAGLTQQQANTIFGGYLRQQAESVNAMAQQKGDAVTALRNEWGANYESKMSVVHATVKQLATSVLGDEGANALAEELDSSVLGDHPQLARVMEFVGRHMLEDGAIRDLANGGGKDASISELSREIDELRETEAYIDHNHSDHRKTVNRLNTLYEQRTKLRDGEAA